MNFSSFSQNCIYKMKFTLFHLNSNRIFRLFSPYAFSFYSPREGGARSLQLIVLRTSFLQYGLIIILQAVRLVVFFLFLLVCLSTLSAISINELQYHFAEKEKKNGIQNTYINTNSCWLERIALFEQNESSENKSITQRTIRIEPVLIIA